MNAKAYRILHPAGYRPIPLRFGLIIASKVERSLVLPAGLEPTTLGSKGKTPSLQS